MAYDEVTAQLLRENRRQREALEAVAADPVINGMRAHIRIRAAEDGRHNPLELVRAALGVKTVDGGQQ